jgi:anthranilate/para-aminobenzoate synthase component I
MSVAIRTAVIEGGRLTYGVGAGIVADSDPQSEWEETLAKAGVIMGLARERGARM